VSIEIYIGGPIEHASEREGLERVVALLAADGVSAVLLANVTMGSRQIDLVVALDHFTLLLEEKAYSVPVRGGANGQWQVRLASGEWKNMPNHYLQALGAKNALRDAMSQFAGGDVAYPDAALLYLPAIPSGSSAYGGDQKVSVGGMAELPELIQRRDGRHWTLAQWRAFAAGHRLERVDSLAAALDSALLGAERLLSSYRNSFTCMYAPMVAGLVSFSCTDQNETKSLEELTGQIARGESLILSGPSGCGKSLGAIRAGLECLDQGRIPVIVYAKDFAGTLKEPLDREVALLDVTSAWDLFYACRQLGRPLVLIVDGFNECAEAHRARLTRSIAAACRRYLASSVITTSIPLERAELLNLQTIQIFRPTLATKQAIAVCANGGQPLPATFDLLLDSVFSGLEAQIVGEIGRTVEPEASRFALFDGFVRKRFDSEANDAIRALTLIASLLSDRLSFVLSVRDLGRLADDETISAATLRRLHVANLLVTRGDRVSFSHELFLNAFSSEVVIRRARGSAAAINVALRAPQNADRKALIVGAIDDQILLSAVLADVWDEKIIAACATGQCGHPAKLWAERRFKEVLERVRAEIARVTFKVGNDCVWGVEADPQV
jgi:hypothetical protein